ncbi:MAG: ATP-dependent dethiobiotin synthetase BioD [Kiritimatiellae bacterium]|nr:ATP-dependent dethiobiotin synthetase BioD [Kiritimatiellia bacterium]
MVTVISGVDTDAGKSIATGWWARRLMASGKRVITQKLVQTGNRELSEDVLRHRAMMGIPLLPEDEARLTMPEIYSYPCSPHLAARLDRRPLDLQKITEATAILDSRYDEVLLEGAGGLMVPLTDSLLTIDYIQANGYPMIFVTGGVLGSISHTLLAFEALERRPIRLTHIIYNRYPGRNDRLIDDESCAYLQREAAQRFPEAEWLELPILELSHASCP